MNSQEELAGCLQQIMDALAPDTRRLSIVRDGDKPRVDRAQERHVGRYQDVTTAAIHALARPGGVRGVRRQCCDTHGYQTFGHRHAHHAGQMKFKDERLLAPREAAEKKLPEIANAMEADHGGRLSVQSIRFKQRTDFLFVFVCVTSA